MVISNINAQNYSKENFSNLKYPFLQQKFLRPLKNKKTGNFESRGDLKPRIE